MFPKGVTLMFHPSQKNSFHMTSPVAATLLAILLLIFAATLPTNAQTFNVIHSFTGIEGATPMAGVTIDGAGNLYGTTVHGGNNEQGVVFKLARVGSSWILTPLYKFTGTHDGYHPEARVIFGPDGPYSTTYEGGAGGWELYSACNRPRTVHALS
jgi:uncharacterized repeat protein (TIGR03803 family)